MNDSDCSQHTPQFPTSHIHNFKTHDPTLQLTTCTVHSYSVQHTPKCKSILAMFSSINNCSIHNTHSCCTTNSQNWSTLQLHISKHPHSEILPSTTNIVNAKHCGASMSELQCGLSMVCRLACKVWLALALPSCSLLATCTL